MEFRKAELRDLEVIMSIIRKAQDQFKKDGIDQWQNNYPNEDIIKSDIEKEESYVLLKDNTIVGTVYLSFTGESDYDKIYQGQWLTEGPYAVIHRVAVELDLRGQGLASRVMEFAVNKCKDRGFNSIKVDTHKDNKPMQRLLDKYGFKYCGLIYLKSGAERIAFEKVF